MSAHWIFGYGSLVWRPDFPFAERVTARLDGYSRRFWQGSPDHRGTPEAPGRVVTLVPSSESVVGRAFRLRPTDVEDVVARLDHREKEGYEMVSVQLALMDGRCVVGDVYLATRTNPSFLGPAPIEEMAKHIARSEGPSGPNVEYLLRLHEALGALGHPDDHVSSLVSALPRGLDGRGAE